MHVLTKAGAQRTHTLIDINSTEKGLIRDHVAAPWVMLPAHIPTTELACLDEEEWQDGPTLPHTAAVSQQLSLISPPQFTSWPPSLFMSASAAWQKYMYKCDGRAIIKLCPIPTHKHTVLQPLLVILILLLLQLFPCHCNDKLSSESLHSPVIDHN